MDKKLTWWLMASSEAEEKFCLARDMFDKSVLVEVLGVGCCLCVWRDKRREGCVDE